MLNNQKLFIVREIKLINKQLNKTFIYMFNVKYTNIK